MSLANNWTQSTHIMTVRFEIVIKNGPHVLADVMGHKRDGLVVSMEDVNKVVEIEQYLNRIFGHRFHINAIADGDI